MKRILRTGAAAALAAALTALWPGSKAMAQVHANATPGPARGSVPAAADPAGCGSGRTLRRGDTGEDVRALQAILADLGYPSGEQDGRFGPSTVAALRAFQAAQGLIPDGVAGPATRAQLAEFLAARPHAPYQPGGPEVHILVDVRRNQLTLLLNGFPYRVYRVAAGKPSSPSPVGQWRVVHKSRDWGGGFGTRWLGLNVPWGIYGIHGTNKPWLVGQDVSAGCIRMRNRDVEELYELVPIGTPVWIFGDPVLTRRTLVEGHTGADVAEVQARLRELGFYNGPIDGRFGPGTRQAVIAFQKARGLAPTGIVRWDTYRALGLGP